MAANNNNNHEFSSSDDTGYNADIDATPTSTESDDSIDLYHWDKSSSTSSGDFADPEQHHIYNAELYALHVPATAHQAVFSGRSPFPTRPLVKKKRLFPLPYAAIPDLDLPLPGEPGFQEASAVSEAMISYLQRLQPIPNELLTGYSPSEDEYITASRRVWVTEYYEDMMWTNYGSLKVKREPHSRRSARVQAMQDAASTSTGVTRTADRPWFQRPSPEDDDSSS